MPIEHAAFAHGIFSNVPFTLPLRTSTSGCSGPRLHCKACRALRIHRRAYTTRGFHGLMDKPLASLSPLASIALSISFHSISPCYPNKKKLPSREAVPPLAVLPKARTEKRGMQPERSSIFNRSMEMLQSNVQPILR